jgi:hypothetical protein
MSPQPQKRVVRPDTPVVESVAEGSLMSPEPTTTELNLRRVKLALEIAAALRRQVRPPSRFADE